jgi:hypothetical protein
MMYGKSGADSREDDSPIPSTSDDRVEASAVRHTYRVLSDEEKASVDRIKDTGQALIDQLLASQRAATNYLSALLSSISPDSREGAIALERIIDGFGLDVKWDEETVTMPTTTEMRIKVEESVMWAVKAVTAVPK